MAPEDASHTPATVVLIDDDPDIRMLAQMALELEGNEVRAAEDGHAGLDAIRAVVGDGVRPVVVLDVQMPDIDGWEVLAAVRADGGIAHVPVIMCTVRAGGLDRERGYGLGADAYQPKPFDLDELTAIVGELAGLDQATVDERRASISTFIAGEED